MAYDSQINDCKNHYTSQDIERKFMENEREEEVCMKCENLVYSNGIMTCKYLMGQYY